MIRFRGSEVQGFRALEVPRSRGSRVPGFCASAVVVLSAGLAAVTLHSQQTGQAPVFRASIDLIQVDVSALDRDGRPVRGLAATDFTLLENGKPQPIVGFVAVDVPTAPKLPAAWLRDIAPDVRTNDLGDGRLFALLMDDATMPPDLRMAANARDIARSVVRRMGPADLAAVIFVSDTRRSVDFTNDRTRLLEAIDGFTPGFAYSDQVSSTDNQLFFASIRTLGLVAGNLARVPQRRKAVIYVSTGAPVEASSVASIQKIGFRGTPALDVLIPGSALDETTSRELAEALNEIVETRPQEAYGAAVVDTFVRAQNGNVNVYCVDPSGVGGMQAFFQQRVRNARLGGPLMTPVEAITQAQLHRDFLQTVADGSGGRAILATNDLEAGLTRIFEENSSYYLLGYQSTREPSDRSVRRVSVRVNRPDVTARTRNAYIGAAPAAPPGNGAPGETPEFKSRLAGILPSPEVALRATAAAFRIPGRRAGIALATAVEQRAIGDAGARVLEQLDVLATAYSTDGRARGSVRQTARATLRAGHPDTAVYEVLSRIDLDPGRYQIRLAANSRMSGKTGSVYFDIDVPDFTRERLALSGMVLSVTPALAAAPADAAEALVPVVPTSRRTFTTSDAVLGFLRIYQGAQRPPQAVNLAVRITDGSDRVVIQSTHVVNAETFVARQADARFTVPVATLAPGEYLLSVEAAQPGRTVTRHVRFTIY